MIQPPPKAPYTIVLTGGIASGKSAATGYFAKLGAPIIDTDILAREVVAKGTPGLSSIAKQFGEHLLNDDGTLNRRQLRQLVFNNLELREQLESILHPLIETGAIQQLDELKDKKPPYVIIAVPLYVETTGFRWANRVLVIDVSVETQLQRLQQRDQIDAELAQRMLGAQASREQRLAVAHDVIANEGTLEQLEQHCLQLHQKYLSFSDYLSSLQ